MPEVKILSQSDVMQVMEMQSVIECVENVYCQKCSGDTVVWPTTFYEFDPGYADMDIKSGYLREAKLYGHKTVSWFSANKERGLPDLTGIIVVYSAENGMPIGVMDASYITSVRTGAAGAIGAKYLARKNSKNLLVVGSGNQALFQIAAMLTVFPKLEKIIVANVRTPEHAEAFVQELPQKLETQFGIHVDGLTMTATGDLKSALSDADIVITVTPSKEPLIKKEWVRPGTHFSCMGADMPGKQEVESAVLAGATIFVDDKEHCISSREVELPLKQGIISMKDISGEIGNLILGKTPGRQSESEITVYDSTGMALLDIAAAKVALELAEQKGLGVTVKL